MISNRRRRARQAPTTPRLPPNSRSNDVSTTNSFDSNESKNSDVPTLHLPGPASSSSATSRTPSILRKREECFFARKPSPFVGGTYADADVDVIVDSNADADEDVDSKIPIILGEAPMAGTGMNVDDYTRRSEARRQRSKTVAFGYTITYLVEENKAEILPRRWASVKLGGSYIIPDDDLRRNSKTRRL